MTSSADRRAGDLLLVCGSPEPTPARHAETPWRRLAEAGGWTLLEQAPGSRWTGLPLATCRVAERRGWLLGETWGEPDAWRAVVAGDADAEDLNGQFLLWVWDEPREEWSVRTDRFGTVHAYHGGAGESRAVGTFHPAVAAVARATELDWTGLAGFFGAGYFPGDRTFFEGVRILRPATVTRFGAASGPVSERYRPWRHEPRERPRERLVEELAAALETVVGDHVRNVGAAIPVSGGLDSRCLVAAAPRGSGSIRAFSYGYGDDSLETRIAGRVARARGLPFDAYRVPRYLERDLDLALAAVEGFQDVTQTRQIGVAAEVGASADVVLGGHWGDVWLDTLGLEGERAVSRERAADRLLRITRKPADWLDRHLSGPALGRDPAALRREMVLEELAPYDGIEDPDFRIKAFKTDQWSFRWTLASVRAYRPAALPRLPFYDTRLTDFISTVPSDHLRGRSLQIEYLRRKAPDLARILWQARNAHLFAGRFAGASALARRGGRKLRRALRRRPVLQRNWEVQFGGAAGRRFLNERLLDAGAPLRRFVEPETVRALLARLDEEPHDGALGYQVSMLFTFGAWLEWSGRLADVPVGKAGADGAPGGGA